MVDFFNGLQSLLGLALVVLLVILGLKISDSIMSRKKSLPRTLVPVTEIGPQLGAMHVVLDLLECEPERLIGWKKWYPEIKAAIVRSGMTIATHHSTGSQCELGHDYPGEGSGYTFCVYVLESHVIVHTTPESNLVNVCVFFCNFREDNSAKAIAVADELAKLFGSKNPKETRVPRYS